MRVQPLTAFLPFFIARFSLPVLARKFQNTGGTIVLEEAWTVPNLLAQQSTIGTTPGTSHNQLLDNLVDIHNQRLTQMNTNGIDFMVLSCASPCVQGIADPDQAAQLAIQLNNELASQISNNTERFGAFAALAMQNASVAAAELRRAVTQLGFLGALVNDYQQSGSDGNTLLYYSEPQYDEFWTTVVELDVPVYFHPRENIEIITNLQYAQAPFLEGPAQEFAVTLSNHILGLCVNGVFDRFPKLKIIAGHLGERIPSDLVRIDGQLQKQIALGMPMQKNVTFYFHNNIWETTSGNFAPDLLNFHINQIGLDRIMYSIDYPFVNIPDGTAFVQQLSRTMRRTDFNSLIRNVAIDILKLND